MGKQRRIRTPSDFIVPPLNKALVVDFWEASSRNEGTNKFVCATLMKDFHPE